MRKDIAPATTLVSGLGLVESVRCRDGAVWFADWHAGTIHRYDLNAGRDELTATVPSFPLCFDIDPEARLVVLDSQSGTLLRGSPGQPLAPWVDLTHLSSGAGNEVLAVEDGSFFLNFGNFDPTEGFPNEPVGLVAHVDPQGRATVVAEGLAFPNGMALTPDGSTLLVAESHAGRITAYAIGTGGVLGERREWAQVPGSAPDGIAMTADGTCWYADVPNQAVVGVTEGGRVRAAVPLDRGGFSCGVSPDGKELFVAAAHWPGGERIFDPTHHWDGSLLRIDVPASPPGADGPSPSSRSPD
ncbi:MAG: SMP-30/gluconolactonase/LRE family protein [Actinomycetia bacterium]|nr:SMP-30/gluconolactonase/LRE family protein [Actinomycetes bacterium]